MERVSVCAVGDVTPGLNGPPESSFVHVMEPLRSADVRFAQSERVYSERGSQQVSEGPTHRPHPPQFAAAFKSVPFDVVSIASNKTGAWGPEAAADTVDTFRKLGLPTIGAGHNIADARQPVIIMRKGLRIAFLAYVSVLPPQFWATETRAGVAPMRARTYYEPYDFQPGSPAHVVTIPHAKDLEQLVADVRQAKQKADVVFISLHWGVTHTWRPCDYQPVVAHAAIDAGATAILGHHPHQPQGIELYKGGVIFYSIGNFATFRSPARKGEDGYCTPNMEFRHKDAYAFEPDPGRVYEHRRHYNEGGIAFVEVDRQGLARAAYMPTLMNDTGQPEVVRPDHPQFEKSLTYLNWAGKFIDGGATQIKAAGDRYEVFARNGG